MARTIPKIEPTQATAGESWDWDVERLATDYPAASWDVTYYLVGPTPTEITAVESSETHQIRFLATKSAKLKPGIYRLVGRVTDGTTVDKFYDEQLVVIENPSKAKARTDSDERVLEVIVAAIEGRLTADIESYQVRGTAVSKIPIEQLVRLRGIYAARVSAKHRGSRLGRGVQTAFGPW